MHITHVEAIWLRVPPLEGPCEWGDDAFVVLVHTDTGLVGVGESDSSPAVLKAIVETPASHASCRGLRDILIGENPLDIDRLWRRMIEETSYMGRLGAVIHAISAIDIALWDIAGQHHGVPVHRLLGGKLRDRIPAYGTFIPADDPAAIIPRTEALLASGLTRLKIGGGRFGLDPAADRRIVAAVRQAAGPEAWLAIDLVYRWKDFDYARRQADDLAGFDLAWIEEPLPPDDAEGLRQLAASIPTGVAGGEGLSTVGEFASFLAATQPAVIQPDITRCGGITEMRKISALAARQRVRLVPHGFSTGILIAATAHFLASVPGGDLIEFTQSESPLATRLVANPLPLVDGCIVLNDRPGLGVALDRAVVDRYRVDVRSSARSGA